MRKLKAISLLLFIFSLFSLALAQQEDAKLSQASATPLVTAGSSAERVRFAAPGTVVQIRLQIYTDTAQLMFDATSKGNVFDWTVQDGTGERLRTGAYLCVVTVKSLSGWLSQRIAELTVQENETQLRSIDVTQLTTAQQQEVGPVEQNASIVVLKDKDAESTTVIAHNGEDAQISRSSGALSFRIGDFFRGKDTEQMRLTSEGNLGIGITQPQARLDVNGFVRASEGIVFPDGSVQLSASRKTFGPASLKPGEFFGTSAQGQEHLASETSGTGTTGKIPKWLDGPNGVLTDSNIFELNNSIGINGSPSSSFKLDVNGTTRIRGSNPAFNLVGLRPAGNQWVFQTVDDDGRFRLFGQDNVNPGAERLTIKLDTGNVGIGTTSPGAKLHVAGGMRWGAVSAPPYVYSDEDAGGLFLEQVGTTTANSKMRLQSSVFGGQSAYSQFFIDPFNGFSFVSNGGANGNVGIGVTSPSWRLEALGGAAQGGIKATGGERISGAGDSGVGLRATGGHCLAGPSSCGGGDGVIAVGGNCSGCASSFSGGYGVIAIGGNSDTPDNWAGTGLLARAGVATNGARPQLAISAEGDVFVSGDLEVSGSKDFKIDHPLDPENKYLVHASIESSEVLNLYSGNVLLGSDGSAVVTLPDWFGALNRDFRYQLTALGAPAQGLYIAEKITGNRFKIAGGPPGLEVSWQVTGVRSDAMMLKRPFKVEQEKAERGYYLHPELFNQPKERGIAWAHNPETMRQLKESRLKRSNELKEQK